MKIHERYGGCFLQFTLLFIFVLLSEAGAICLPQFRETENYIIAALRFYFLKITKITPATGPAPIAQIPTTAMIMASAA